MRIPRFFMQYTWQLALVLVYFIKHSVSCYILHIQIVSTRQHNSLHLKLVCYLDDSPRKSILFGCVSLVSSSQRRAFISREFLMVTGSSFNMSLWSSPAFCTLRNKEALYNRWFHTRQYPLPGISIFARERKFLTFVKYFYENIFTHLSGLKGSPLDTISTIVSVSLNAFKLSTPLAVLRGSTHTKYHTPDTNYWNVLVYARNRTKIHLCTWPIKNRSPSEIQLHIRKVFYHELLIRILDLRQET